MPRIQSPSEEVADARMIERERGKKLPLLFAHYAIDPNSADALKDLACALADRPVPGFLAQRAQGRHLTVSIHTLCKLYRFARDRKLRSRRCVKNNSKICESLAKDAEFKRQVPELARCGKKRLENLLAKACVLRQSRAQALRQERAYWRRIKQLPAAEQEKLEDFRPAMWGDIPYWPTPGADKRFRKKYA